VDRAANESTFSDTLSNLSGQQDMTDGYQLIESQPVSRPVEPKADNGFATFMVAFVLVAITLPFVLAKYSPDKPPKPAYMLTESEKSQQRYAIQQEWQGRVDRAYPDWSELERRSLAATAAAKEISEKQLEPSRQDALDRRLIAGIR